MPITGVPTTLGNDIVTVTPTGFYSVDGQAGTDTLILDFSTLGADIRNFAIGGGWYRYVDDVRTTVDFIGFERYNISGGAGDDSFFGGALNDSLSGGLGNDQFDSGLGADTIVGGGGVDRWVADYSASAAAINLTLSSVATATIAATGANLTGVETITLTTGAAADTLVTEAYSANDVVSTGGGNDLVALGRGVDSANGGDDVDTLRMDWSGITDPNSGIGSTNIGGGWIRYAAGANRTDFVNFERFHLIGGAGQDGLNGGALNDTLVGNAGNDYLNSGAGVDSVSGGDGIDTWQVDTSARSGTTTIDLLAQTTNYGASISGIERINFTGGNGVDRITALAGVYDDTISTGAGNDVVTTGRGVDSANGGDGTLDRLVMDWSGISDPRFGIYSTNIGGGWTRYASASGDRLDYIGFETFALTGGAGDDALSGGSLNDTLVGGAGDDTLSSGIGDATITGGLGNDLWSADLSAEGAVVFSASSSQTTAQLTAIGSSITGIERLSLVTGNGADNISTSGFALNDLIASQGGNDTLYAGTGIDTVDGGSGTDMINLNYASATTGIDDIAVGGGWHRYRTADGSMSTDYYEIERFYVTGGLGNDQLHGGNSVDRLIGNAGDDVLNGGRGADSINGGAGIDTYIGDYSNLATAVTLTLSAAGAGTIGGGGTTLDAVENISLATGSGADVINLSAARGSDTISSGAGDDIIYTGRGIYESVDCGEGTDTLRIDASLATSGVRMSNIGGGWTRAQATDSSYTADFAGVEHFQFLGSAGSDRVYGFNDADVLNGRGGVDFLDGGRGNDKLTGGAGADVFVFSDLWNAGRDLINDREDGDLIRLNSLQLVGTVASNNGSGLLTGGVSVSTAGGVTTLHIGMDGVAGSDLDIDMTGTFSAADFSLSGTDILFV